MGEETDEGEFFGVWDSSVGVITQAPRGAITWGNPAIYAGSIFGWGRTYHIYGVLPQDSGFGGVASVGISRNDPQRRTDE